MKKILLVVCICLMFSFTVQATEDFKLESDITGVHVWDRWNGEESEEYDWLVIDVLLTNWHLETQSISELVSGTLVYKKAYSFDAGLAFAEDEIPSLVEKKGSLVFKIPKLVSRGIDTEDVSINIIVDGEQQEVNITDIDTTVPSLYTPGTYTATAWGLESDVTATLTFDENSITDVAFDVSGETHGIGTETAEPLAAAILEAQSAEVDVVAGASITSGAALEAAADCIAQASGSAAEEFLISETEIKEVAEDPVGAAAYVPGTYTATVKGLESDVTAALTFDETSITDVVFDVSGETKGIGTETGEPLAAAILEAQSADVDVVAGASITSGAALEAAAACIAQASGSAVVEAGTETVEEVATEITDGTAHYVPGTYTASAKGLESDVIATLTFNETSITDVSFDVSGETNGIGTEAGEPLATAIMEAQSAEVDVIAGASITSGAAIEAAGECIAKALQ